MRKILFATAALWLINGSAQAQERDWIARGIGVASCSEYLRLYRADPRDTMREFSNWAMGYMTGANLFMSASVNQYRNVGVLTVEAIDAYMHQYCVTHPTNAYSVGVLELFGQTPVRDIPADWDTQPIDPPAVSTPTKRKPRTDFR